MRRALFLSSLLLSAACGSEGPGAGAGHEGSSAEGRTAAQGSPGDGANAGGGAPDGLVLRAEPAGSTDVAPVLEARGEGTIRVASVVRVERRDGERWTDAGVTELSLRADCERPAEGCVSLAREGSLRPPAWNGRIGRGQCGCPTCAVAPAGDYRFVVTTCEGGHEVASRAFHVGE